MMASTPYGPGASAAAAAAAAVPSPILTVAGVVPLPVPAGTDALYTLSIASSPDASMIALASSDRMVHVLSRITFQHIGSFGGHAGTINEVRFSSQPNVLFSCGTDNCVRVWDTRTGSQTQELRSTSEINSADLNCTGNVLAAGTEAGLLLFWDVRTLAPLQQYEDSHTDAITQVAFHPALPGKLYSGALDGLINIFDITQQTEDDALVGVLNVEDDVHKMGCFGPQYEYVWCSSQTETLAMFNGNTFDRLGRFVDARERAAVDYFVGGRFDPLTQRLVFVSGTHTGSVVLTNATPTALSRLVAADGVHEATLRCADWQSDLLVTAGEDSRLAVWRVALPA